MQRTATGRGLDVLSILTQQDLVSLAERALMPSVFLAIFLGTGPIDDVGDPKKASVAIFNGQYILAKRDAYDAIGGHAAVKGEIAEDMELARRFKSDGRFRIALSGSEGIAHTRMYRSFAEIWAGFEKISRWAFAANRFARLLVCWVTHAYRRYRLSRWPFLSSRGSGRRLRS